MTGHDDFDRTLDLWFETDALASPPVSRFDEVIDATRLRRPRPAWLAGPGSHWVAEAPRTGSTVGVLPLPRLRLRWSTALLILLAMTAVLGGAIVAGGHLFHGPLLPTARLGHLAYLLDGDIYVADWDGANPVRIADGPPGDPPACMRLWNDSEFWSRDGRHLAYRRGGAFCPTATVVITDPAGNAVASFPGTGWNLAWSPDSTRVVTWVELSKTIGIYGLDGVRQALLTLPPGQGPTGDYDPVWSPDGRSLLIRLGPPSPSVIWEIPVDGSTPQPVADDDVRSEYDAVFSLDGTRVAFVPYLESHSLVIAAADGTVLRVLVGPGYAPSGPGIGDFHWNPIWSPTADQVAYRWSDHSFLDFGEQVDPASRIEELRLVDVASGTVTILASARGTSFQLLRFSPEGDRILYLSTDAPGQDAVWSVRIDGSDARLLVPGATWAGWQSLPAGS